MIAWKRVFEFVARCLAYSSILIAIDLVIIVAITQTIDHLTSSLSFLMLFEGGICLIAGGAAAFYSPAGAKIAEVFFKSKPWNAARQKGVEKQAEVWIIVGTLLILVAFLISAL